MTAIYQVLGTEFFPWGSLAYVHFEIAHTWSVSKNNCPPLLWSIQMTDATAFHLQWHVALFTRPYLQPAKVRLHDHKMLFLVWRNILLSWLEFETRTSISHVNSYCCISILTILQTCIQSVSQLVCHILGGDLEGNFEQKMFI